MRQEFYYIDIENVFKVDYLMLIFVKKERNMEWKKYWSF